MAKQDLLDLLQLAHEVTDEFLKDSTMSGDKDLFDIIFKETYHHLLADRRK